MCRLSEQNAKMKKRTNNMQGIPDIVKNIDLQLNIQL
jgi:hypothetical protein